LSKFSISSFGRFIASERIKYKVEDDNRVAFSLGRIARYLRFLEIIKQRYQIASKENLKIINNRISWGEKVGSRNLTPKEVAELQRDFEFSQVLHLEIESFFLFANITLDRIANFMEDYFGPAKSLTLRSHRKFCKYAGSYVKKKKLEIPEGFYETMNNLEESVVFYRDKSIAHLKNPRAMFPTFFTLEGSTQIGTSFLYPKEKDQVVKSPEIEIIYDQIDIYVKKLIGLIQRNRNRSRYRLREN